ncbi:hypothetical protein IFM5058_05052 [Aspergillus udagawae]|nr:hypothetical protein IFM5058_05052 [Aspergillus udagawae]
MHDDQDNQLRETLVEPTNSAISTPGSDRHSVDDDSSNQQGAGSDKPNPPNPSVPLQRSVYIVFLTLLYGAAALYAWVIICILTYRPIGAAISPVQHIFLSYKTIKRVGYPVSLTQITDFTDLFPDSGPDIELDATKLRATLASTVNTVVQPRLWPTANGTVSLGDKSYYTYSALQTKSQNTLANISTITDPFWAELPTSTNTGLLQQFAPRIKSTPIWENNSAAVLPEDCKSSSDAFYLHYKYGQDNDAPFQYDIEICILGNMSQSPWKNQLSRQDFSEELYFQMNFSGDGGMLNYVPRFGTHSRKLTLHTTTDYFELPNYANGQVPGPLIEESPFGRSPRNFTPRDLANDTAWTTLDATLNVINVNNKGPLLYIAMALFGEGSFADVQHTVLAAYANSGISYGGCIDTIPFIPLLDDPHSSFKSSPGNPCLTGSGLTGNGTRDRVYNDDRMHAIVTGYFFLFSGDPT